jgi:hypothetical protein
MSAFNPVARSGQGYGHQAYIISEEGQKLNAEDGNTLYMGGVILQPDAAYFSSLRAVDRTAFFNLLLFGRHLFGWRNVDIFSGKRVAAPALLDLGVRYAFHDIRGSDLTLEPLFMGRLAEGSLRLLGPEIPMPAPVRGPFCAAVADYEAALASAGKAGAADLTSEARRDLAESPFMTNPKARAKMEQFVSEKPRFEALEANLKASYREALQVLSKGRPRLDAACGGTLPP